MFKSKITKIGELAEKLLIEDNMIILFYDDVPKDLHEIAVLHSKSDITFDINIGDRISIDTNEYDIVDIGKKAQETLKTLGHCTLRITDNVDDEVHLPGEVILLGDKLEKIEVGMEIKVKK